ncbi:hypothetical protein M0805_004058 [Coniferiporia weirii]|nr:hypothetical protein M0805_004058 [Coniferiporia weirii]
MSEAQKTQGGFKPRSSPLVLETPADTGSIDRREQYNLTKEEQVFVETLYRVLPKLFSGLEKPTDDPIPIPTIDEKGSHKMASSQPSSAEVEGGLDSSGDQLEEELRRKVNSTKSKYSQEELLSNTKLTCIPKASDGLVKIIQSFKFLEERIRSVEGGARLMDALVGLEEVATDGIIWIVPDNIDTTLESYKKASGVLLVALRKLGEDVFKDRHLKPLRDLGRFCFGNFGNVDSTSTLDITDRDKIKMVSSLSERINNVTEGLSDLFESALPGFLKVQEKAQSIDYNNMLTAATFFSAVTATTLQLSYTNTQASLGVAVNTLWFVALVFSTASSLNSLVGLTWYQKIRRNHLLPDWAKLWIEYGPMISLAVASAAFSAGLCLFAFSSSQHAVTSTLTAAFTATHTVVLFVPLCLYSQNQLSHSLIKFWYLRKVPRQNRDLVAFVIQRGNVQWSDVNNVCNVYGIEVVQTATSSTVDGSTDSSSSAIGVVKRNIGRAWMFVRSIVTWLIILRPDSSALRRRGISASEEPRDMEQTHGADTSFVELDELERGNGPQEHAGESEISKPTLTEGQGITLSKKPRASTFDITDRDEGAAFATKGLGKEVEHSFDTRAISESTKEPTATTFSAEDLNPGSSSSPTVQDTDNGFDGARKAASTSGRPNASQEEESDLPSIIPCRRHPKPHNPDHLRFPWLTTSADGQPSSAILLRPRSTSEGGLDAPVLHASTPCTDKSEEA